MKVCERGTFFSNKGIYKDKGKGVEPPHIELCSPPPLDFTKETETFIIIINIFKHNLECFFQRFVSIISKEHVRMETVVVLTMSSHHLEGMAFFFRSIALLRVNNRAQS